MKQITLSERYSGLPRACCSICGKKMGTEEKPARTMHNWDRRLKLLTSAPPKPVPPKMLTPALLDETPARSVMRRITPGMANTDTTQRSPKQMTRPSSKCLMGNPTILGSRMAPSPTTRTKKGFLQDYLIDLGTAHFDCNTRSVPLMAR